MAPEPRSESRGVPLVADLERSLAAALGEAAARHGDAPFLSSRSRPEEGCTFAGLHAEARAVARGLVRAGVAPGDRVALLSENRPRWCAAHAAVVHAGAVVVTLDAELHPAAVAGVLEHAGVRHVLASEGAAPSLEEARALGLVDRVLGLDPGVGDLDWEAAKRRGEGARLPALAGGEAPACVLYTSGTTGAPKGVVLTHANLAAEAAAVAGALAVDGRDVLLMFLPMHHALSQLGAFLLPYLFGARVVHVDVQTPADLRAALLEEQATILLAVPLLYHRLHEGLLDRLRGSLVARAVFALCRALAGPTRGAVGRRLLPLHRALGGRLRLCVSGASALHPAAQRDLVAAGLPMAQAYGLTECTGGATLTPVDRVETGSVGAPLPGVSVRIDAPDDEGVGEVLLRGPNLMAGYWQDADATDACLHDGWLRTGDLGRLDARGELRLRGRAKEVIVLENGKNVNPEAVEARYAREPAIAELCVLPEEDGAGVVRALRAVVVPDWERLAADGTSSVRERVRSDLLRAGADLPAYARVQDFELRREPLPRTATRKLQRFRVAAEAPDAARADHAAADSPEAAARLDTPAGRALAALVAQRAPAGAVVRGKAHLELDLGLDSLRRTELLVAAERALGLQLDDEEREAVQTLDDLLRRVPAEGAPATPPADVGGETEDGAAWSRIVAEAGEADLPPWMRGARGPVSTALLFLAVTAVRAVALVLFRVRVEGREHLPADGAFLVCPNHVSFLDSILVPAFLPFAVVRRGFVIGHAMYVDRGPGRLVARLAAVVPTDADARRDASIRACAAGLKQGRPLVLFPEGTRSVDGSLHELRLGAAVLASELELPVVPARLVGAHEAWPRGRRLPRPRGVRIVLGPPLRPQPAPPGATPAARHEALRSRLRAALLDLGCPPGAADVADDPPTT